MMSAKDEVQVAPDLTTSVEGLKKDMKSILKEAEIAFANQDYEAAVTLYAKCLEETIQQNEGDQMAPAAGLLYLAYGKALLQLAIANNSPGLVNEPAIDLVGAAPDKQLIEFNEYEDDSEEEEEDQNGEEEDDEEEGGEQEDGDDFALAWEVLDIARLIFSRQDSAKLQEAEALQEMGNLSIETENFATAVSDYKKAAEILDQVNASQRERAYAHFNIGIALEYESQDLPAAKAAYQKAKDLLVELLAEKSNLKDSEDDDKGVLKKEDQTGNDLEELINEIDCKMKELDNGSTAAISLKDILMDAAKSASSTTAAQVNDLSSLVKKRKVTPEEGEEEKDCSKLAKNE